jgi:hypothetical protein
LKRLKVKRPCNAKNAKAAIVKVLMSLVSLERPLMRPTEMPTKPEVYEKIQSIAETAKLSL